MNSSIRPTHSRAASIVEARILAPTIGAPLRRAGGLTLADVGRHCGCRRQSVWAWEMGIAKPAGQRAIKYLGLLRELESLL